MAKYSMEKMFQIWDDTSGARIEVGADRDGLGLIAIRQYSDGESKCNAEVIFSVQEASLIQEALKELVAEKL